MPQTALTLGLADRSPYDLSNSSICHTSIFTIICDLSRTGSALTVFHNESNPVPAIVVEGLFIFGLFIYLFHFLTTDP